MMSGRVRECEPHEEFDELARVPDLDWSPARPASVPIPRLERMLPCGRAMRQRQRSLFSNASVGSQTNRLLFMHHIRRACESVGSGEYIFTNVPPAFVWRVSFFVCWL